MACVYIYMYIGFIYVCLSKLVVSRSLLMHLSLLHFGASLERVTQPQLKVSQAAKLIVGPQTFSKILGDLLPCVFCPSPPKKSQKTLWKSKNSAKTGTIHHPTAPVGALRPVKVWSSGRQPRSLVALPASLRRPRCTQRRAGRHVAGVVEAGAAEFEVDL